MTMMRTLFYMCLGGLTGVVCGVLGMTLLPTMAIVVCVTLLSLIIEAEFLNK